MSHRNYIINIYCSACKSHIYKYLKEGEGHLLKCYASNILENKTKLHLHCPGCGKQFAREALVHNRPAHKIIQGSVFV
ncbi:MAG: hypothetical protein V1839_03745 [archaeon]